ncbi:SURF1 family protein [Pseudooceanicola nitratireducens]|uniref:SURF1 family protein n=1 Tax=Pseudooceanicola nitratireducens TaxID=517719 RepID=UPI001C93A2F0|nr:SURF1 family protein [Pseudooceanicola nitratireducens]MBY6166783.1 SURF1 family protein [Pseudooceanicola nitratireducens]
MLRKLIGPVIFGIGGAAVLVSLGMWQVRRMEWKEGVLSAIEARIAAAPIALPQNPTEQSDQYLPVTLSGHFGETGLRVLSSRKQVGPGHRLIHRFETGDRSIMIDRGFLPNVDTAPALPSGEVTITGNLAWPDETDSFTPEPDITGGLWFARDVAAMAAALGTEPVLVVARDTSYDAGAVGPMPVTTVGIPNDHREYAITWFSLAAIWLAMTGYLFYRTLRPQKGEAT